MESLVTSRGSKVTYDQFSTHYMVGGMRYDRISHVISGCYNRSAVDMEYYFDRGTAVHASCHLWLMGKIQGVDKLHVDIRGMVSAFVKFWTDFKAEILHSEEFVYSKKWRYGGIPDIRCYKPGDECYWVIDLKSGTASKPPKATAMQTAAYAEAWKELDQDESVRTLGVARMGVILRPDGTYGQQPYYGSGDFQAFLTLLSAERVRERYSS